MASLNDKNGYTEKVIHIMVTSLCNRDCKYCCNKQYSLDDIPYVTNEELLNAETVCITGGEPFLFCNPCEIAKFIKNKYHNIRNVYVYTNALELADWLTNNTIHHLDGVNVSIKTKADALRFNEIISNTSINSLRSNLVYVFDDLIDDTNIGNFAYIKRNWQKDFKAANDSIFRKI